MVSKPITSCSVTRWGSTPHGMKCSQRTKTVGAVRPLERGINGNQRLDPGNVAAVPTTVTTDATGFAFFDVVYAKEFGGDVAGVTVGVVEVELKARTVVVGSEGSSRALFFLPGECVILTTPPFGTGMNCTDNDF